MKKLSLILSLLFALPVYSQRFPGAAEFDLIGFARDSGHIQLELYYSIVQQFLPFTQSGDSWSAPIDAKITIYQDEKPIREETISKHISVKGSEEDLKKTASNTLVDAMYFTIGYSKNTYAKMIFQLKDLKGNAYSDTLQIRCDLPTDKKDTFSFGGIQFGSKLEEAAGNEQVFEKVGYVLTPNPSNTFGGDYGTLNYYTEVYAPASATGSNIEVTSRILDGALKEVSSKKQTVKVSSHILPFLATFDIDGLPTDSYYLEITAKKGDVVVARTAKVFYYENSMKLSEEETQAPASQIIDEESLFQLSDISKLGELELSERLAQAEYLMTSNERKTFKPLKTPEEKKRALFKFWRSKDEEGAKPLSYYRAYCQRVDMANKKFTYQKTMGWKSDRGRIYILYGEPDHIRTELFSTEAKPYIYWEYINRGIKIYTGNRAYFYFLDKLGGGNFIIIDSNVQGEVSEPDWYNREALRVH
jgi:GWxTD domain-containing protein